MTGSTARVLVLDPGVTDADLAEVRSVAGEGVAGVHVIRGDGWAVLPLADGVHAFETTTLERLHSVQRLVEISAPFRLASRELFGDAVGIEVRLVEMAAIAMLPRVTFGGRARHRRHRKLPMGVGHRGEIPVARAAAARRGVQRSSMRDG